MLHINTLSRPLTLKHYIMYTQTAVYVCRELSKSCTCFHLIVFELVPLILSMLLQYKLESPDLTHTRTHTLPITCITLTHTPPKNYSTITGPLIRPRAGSKGQCQSEMLTSWNIISEPLMWTVLIFMFIDPVSTVQYLLINTQQQESL